jgi:DNA-binding NtrC family response regulator
VTKEKPKSPQPEHNFPLARVCLGGAVPAQTIALLAHAAIETVSCRDADRADFVFTRTLRTACKSDARVIVSAPREPKARPVARLSRFVADNATEAASFVLSRTLSAGAPMLTGDPTVYAAICSAVSIAALDRPIVLEGETGSGKELLARMVHAAGGLGGRMLAVDCSAHDGSVEIALKSLANAEAAEFGVEPGRAAERCCVTVFLDNIDELAPAMQRRLLAAMRGSQAPARTGDESALGRSATRFIAATTWPLARLVARGSFAQDLDDEFGPRRIFIPPLRRRTGDVVLLARDFLAASGSSLRFTPAALKALCEYPFPGNVRELENLVRRLAIVPLAGRRGTIQAADVRSQLIVATRQKAGSAKATWRSCLETAYSEIVMRALKTQEGDSADASRLRVTLKLLGTRGGLDRIRARIHRI